MKLFESRNAPGCKKKQDRQCAYNVTSQRVRVTSVDTETQRWYGATEYFLLLSTLWKYVVRSSCDVPNMFVRFWQNLEFVHGFSYKSPVSNFTEIRRLEAALMHANGPTDGQTDRHGNANRRFSLLIRMRLVTHAKKCHLLVRLFMCTYLLHGAESFLRS